MRGNRFYKRGEAPLGLPFISSISSSVFKGRDFKEGTKPPLLLSLPPSLKKGRGSGGWVFSELNLLKLTFYGAFPTAFFARGWLLLVDGGTYLLHDVR